MERIPEHELMDDAKQARAYADADFSEPHEAFVAHFKERFPTFSEGSVLDLGCGPADVTIRFSRSFPKAKILGVDGAQSMLDISVRDIRSKGLAHQITLKNCMLPDPSLSRLRFEAVISNSLLHHLRDPEVLWKSIEQCTKPCAPIFVMDLHRPESIEQASEFVKQYAADASPILQKDFYNSLLAAYRAEEIEHQLLTCGLHYLTTEVISDRHVLVWGRRRTYGQ
jgi:ubiquinone/menaquinone biosynthesis C-methylase UbiE